MLPRHFVPLSLFAAVATACATGVELLTPDGLPLASVPPAPYRIAVLPVENKEVLANQPAGLRFTIAADALRDRLVARMDALRAATDTFASESYEAAAASGAELVLIPRLVQAPSLAHVSASKYWWASGLLWITTWIGGLLVPDSTYQARVALECDVRNTLDSEDPVGFGLTAVSGTTDLTFWDRNAFLTGGFFLSIILPPFWTSDNTQITSDSLSARALDQLAGRITSFLKFELAEREMDRYGRVRFDAPVNGATVGETTMVAGVVSGRHTVTAISVSAISVSGKEETVELTTVIDQSIDQQVGTRFYQRFETGAIKLHVGENKIRVRVTIEQDKTRKTWESSRTLKVYRSAENAGESRVGPP